MNGDLTGKTALITGASQGIGLASASALAAAGADIFATDLEGVVWTALRENVSAAGKSLHVVEGDVAKSETWHRLSESVASRSGTLDILFNNAGISGQSMPLWDYPEETFDEVMRVNCRGVFLGLKNCVPLMRERGGSIINTSSVSGIGGGASLFAYNASKHAVVGMTKVGAIELAQFGIRVNAICPAMTETAMMHQLETGKSETEARAVRDHFNAMIPLGRYARPEEIANVVVHLASDNSSFVNGAIIPIDGGLKAQ